MTLKQAIEELQKEKEINMELCKDIVELVGIIIELSKERDNLKREKICYLTYN